MGYQYALHQHKKKLLAEQSELRKSQESYSALSRSIGASMERHRIPAKKDAVNQSIAGEK
jgi:hypothetical protein